MTSFTFLSCAPSITDDEVFQQANDRSALLITADKDFGELVFRQGRLHRGVVLLRLAGLSNATKAEIVAVVFRDRAPELLKAFTVISPGARAHSASILTMGPRSAAGLHIGFQLRHDLIQHRLRITRPRVPLAPAPARKI